MMFSEFLLRVYHKQCNDGSYQTVARYVVTYTPNPLTINLYRTFQDLIQEHQLDVSIYTPNVLCMCVGIYFCNLVCYANMPAHHDTYRNIQLFLHVGFKVDRHHTKSSSRATTHGGWAI